MKLQHPSLNAVTTLLFLVVCLDQLPGAASEKGLHAHLTIASRRLPAAQLEVAMAAVRPIPFERNPLRTPDVPWPPSQLSSDSDADSSDSDCESDASSSSSDFSASTSDQEDNSDSDSDSSSDSSPSEESDAEDYRPPELPLPDVSTSSSSNSLSIDLLLDALGDMACADNVGFIAWLVPFTGLCTMLGTEVLACATHFNCAENYPTLSYAATFRPEGYAFTGGMCLTAIFICASVVLFFWYLRLRMSRQAEGNKDKDSEHRTSHLVTCYTFLLFGVASAVSLFGLAVMDMRTHHDAHLNFTIVFFVTAWVMMIMVQRARESILHEDEAAGADGLLKVLGRRAFWLSLRRWRRLDFFTAYTLGRLLLSVGLASTFLFGIFFLCANGVWPNPLGFTAVQEAFFEAFAIVCQLLFMGTLSSELARLARLVEHRDYTELERSE